MGLMRRVVKKMQHQVRATELQPGDFVRGPDQAWIEVLHTRPRPEHHAVELTLNLEVRPRRRHHWWQPKPPITAGLFSALVDSSAVLDITVFRDIAVDDSTD